MSEERLRQYTKSRHARAYRSLATLISLAILSAVPFSIAQQPDMKPTSGTYPAARTFPKEIRGYKVERAKVEVKKQKNAKTRDEPSAVASSETDALIQFGEASIERMTPLGITLEVPVTIAAVKQKGHVDFLAFEDMVVNDVPVTVEDYNHPFDLPTNKPTQLPKPVRIFISMSSAVMGALGEWTEAKKMWPVIGRVYVFGRFKKFLFNFKRVVPVELELSLPNPLLKMKDESEKAKHQD